MIKIDFVVGMTVKRAMCKGFIVRVTELTTATLSYIQWNNIIIFFIRSLLFVQLSSLFQCISSSDVHLHSEMF